MLLPYRLDVVEEFSTVPNTVLVALCCALQVTYSFTDYLEVQFSAMVLDGWKLAGMFGHMFLHKDIFHLVGNMYFLWLFGNALCSKISGSYYLLLLISCGVFAAVCHNYLDGRPAVGISAALFGVIGFYIALYPKNRASCFFFVFNTVETPQISMYWLVALWVLQDIFRLFGDSSPIAHVAHLSAFFFGMTIASWLLISGRLRMYDYDLKTLPQIISGRLPSKNE